MTSATPTVERAGNSKAMRAVRDEAKFRAFVGPAEPVSFYDRRQFTSASGRTVGFLDAAGMQAIAEEHEWLRDRVAQLEIETARLRSLIETARPIACAEPATV